MSTPNPNNLHKEFELERIILFSDAVFAIAITLLIIEIKFPELPENYKQGFSLFTMFRPTLNHFVGFLISFALIGFSWARHLSTFRYLKGYDTGVIVRNLVCLLFIVAFPFSAEGITHLRPSFMFPMLVYIGNIMLISVSHFALAHYIFKQKPHLSTPGHVAEKTFIYMIAKVTGIALFVVFTIMLATAILSDFNNDYINYSAFAFIPMGIAVRLTTKKYKPKNSQGLL